MSLAYELLVNELKKQRSIFEYHEKQASMHLANISDIREALEALERVKTEDEPLNNPVGKAFAIVKSKNLIFTSRVEAQTDKLSESEQ